MVRTPAELVRANAAILTVQGLGTLSGPVIGGIAVAAAGAASGLGTAAAASAIAAVLLFGVRVEGGALREPAAKREVRDALYDMGFHEFQTPFLLEPQNFLFLARAIATN